MTAASEILARWARDPAAWAREVLGFEPLPMQARMCEAVGRGSRTTVVASCQNSGKDAMLGRLVAHYYNVHPGSKVIVTGPTQKQVQTLRGYVLTAYAEALRRGTRLIGKHTEERTYDPEDPGHEVVYFASRDYQPEAAASWHAERLLVVVTEASGVDERVVTALQGVASGELNQVCMVGNPLRAYDAFHRRFAAPSSVPITIGAPDCPNFLAFGVTRRDLVTGAWREKVDGPLPYPAMLSPQHAAAEVERLGEHDSDVVARIWGEFPLEADDGLFTAEMVAAARDCWRSLEGLEGANRRLGCDPAYLGSDETVIALSEDVVDPWCEAEPFVRLSILQRHRRVATDVVGDRLMELAAELGAETIRVDEGNPGAGVIDRIERRGGNVEGVSFAERPDDYDFLNRRVEMHFAVRDLALRGRLALDPAAEELARQMLAIRRLPPDDRDRKRLERKQDFRRRIGRSPDDLDAAILACGDGYARLQVF